MHGRMLQMIRRSLDGTIAVLHLGPISSPVAAVRASIIQEYRAIEEN